MRMLLIPLILSAFATIPALADSQSSDTPQRRDANGDRLPGHALHRLGTMRLRHGNPVTGLAFAADGKKLVSVSDNLETHCWDVGTAREVSYQKGINDEFRLSMSSAGEVLAIRKGKVCEIRNTLTQQLIGELDAKKDILRSYISPDGRTLAVMDWSPWELTFWNIATKSKMKLQPGKFYPDSPLVFSRDSRLVAYMEDASSTCLWDLSEGKRLRGLSVGRMRVLAFSWHGDLLAAACGSSARTVDIWDVKSGKKLREFKLGELRVKADYSDIRQLAFSRDDTLAVGESTGEITLWNPRTGERVCQLQGHQREVGALTFAPDGKRLASGGYDNTIRLWDAANGQELVPTAGHLGGGVKVQFLGDNRTLCSRWDWNLSPEWQRDEFSTVRFWNTKTGELKQRVTWDNRAGYWPVVHLPTMTLALAKTDGKIELRDLKNGKERSSLKQAPDDPSSVQLSPGGTILAVETVQKKSYVIGKFGRIAVTGRTVHLWNTQTNEKLGNIKLGPSDTFVLSPDEDTIIANTYYRMPDEGWGVRIQAWSALSAKEKRSLELPGSDRQPFVSFLSDGKQLRVETKTSRTRSRLLHWDIGSGDVAAGPEQVGLGCENDQLAANGKIICSSPLRWAKEKESSPGQFERVPNQVLLREALTGLPVRTVELPKGTVHCTGLSSDGKMLAVGSADGGIQVWDVASGKKLAELLGHRGAVTSVSFSRDGKVLCSGSDDTTILVWDIAPFHRGRSKSTLTPAQFQELWDQLADKDVGQAYAAVARLVESPGTTAFLRQKLQPASPLKDAEAKQAVLDLNSESFATRAKADKQLLQMAEPVVPTLRKALANATSLEQRQRLQRIITAIPQGRFIAPHVQRMRALQTLEWIGDGNARQILERLAEGNPDAWLTTESRRTLTRMRKASE